MLAKRLSICLLIGLLIAVLAAAVHTLLLPVDLSEPDHIDGLFLLWVATIIVLLYILKRCDDVWS